MFRYIDKCLDNVIASNQTEDNMTSLMKDEIINKFCLEEYYDQNIDGPVMQ